jgi:hypothetical protein
MGLLMHMWLMPGSWDSVKSPRPELVSMNASNYKLKPSSMFVSSSYTDCPPRFLPVMPPILL